MRLAKSRRRVLGPRSVEVMEGRTLLSTGIAPIDPSRFVGPVEVASVVMADPVDVDTTDVQFSEAANVEELAAGPTPVFEVEDGTAKADATIEIKLEWTKKGKDMSATVKVEIKKGDDNKTIRNQIQDALNKDKAISADWTFKPRTNGAVKIEETFGTPTSDDVKWKNSKIMGKIDGVKLNAAYDIDINLPPE